MFFRKKKMLKKREETIKASLFGFFIGDALGVPVEFIDRSFLKKNHITDMGEYGTHDQPKGTWSDDSSMVLATIDGVLKSNIPDIDYEKIMKNFLQWKQEGMFTPFHQVFDIGTSTSSALSVYQQHVNHNDSGNVICGTGEISSNGNGSLMRILPISLYLYYLGVDYSQPQFFNVIKTISSMTHSHIYSILGCYIYSIYVSELLKGHDKFRAYNNLQNVCKEQHQFKEMKEVYGRIIYTDLSKLKESDIKSSGYVVDSLEASIWAVLTSKSFKEAVLKAVNLGDDTDTIGALTGALAGIIFGYDCIPKKWMNNLQKKEYLNEIVNSYIDYLKNLESIKVSNINSSNIIKNEIVDLIKDNKIDLKTLQDTIDDLKNNPNACTTISGGIIAGKDEKITILGSNPGPQLKKFITYFYENNLMDQDYSENYEKIKEKQIEDYSYEEVLTAITKVIRGDRFISGHIYKCVKNGVMLKLLEKLYSLVK